MSRMMRSDRKPPLARSPIRLRPRRVLHSNPTPLQTPPGSLTKIQFPKHTWDTEESGLRPEYRTISCELRALAKMVENEFGHGDLGNVGFVNNSNSNKSPLFERGRFYDEYSKRRNERLKRKKGETGDEKKTMYGLGVRVEYTKRRETKKFESARKTVPSTPLMEPRETPRYSLRSSSCKENKKPPLAVNFEKSVGTGDRKIGGSRIRKN